MSGWAITRKVFGKPSSISWPEFLRIKLARIRYQPLIFPDGVVIEKKCHESIIDSREKAQAVRFPDDLEGLTVLDVGCAEGFFCIQAALRGAERVIGCDIIPERIKIAKIMAKAWSLSDRVKFYTKGLYSIPPDWASDMVLCFAVAHHLHGGSHDTWRIISQPQANQQFLNNMLRAVEAVSRLTKRLTLWEYSFEYEGGKPDDVDHSLLGRLWVEHGLYDRVEFLGLSQCTPYKDRAIYHAFKG